MQKKPISIFNKKIFWDVDFEKINYNKKASWVIARVFARGDVEDIRQCRRYYGDEKVTVVLQNAKWLSESATHLASAIFFVPLNSFNVIH